MPINSVQLKIAAMILIRLCLAIFLGLAGWATSQPSEAANRDTDITRGLDSMLATAHFYWQRRGRHNYSQEMSDDLRYFALQSPKLVRMERLKAEAAGLEPAFLEKFDAMIAWAENLRAGDPKIAYDLSHTYAKLATKSRRTPKHIALYLLWMASKNGYAPARYEDAQSMLKKLRRLHYNPVGLQYLRQLGHDGFRPAQINLFERYWDGQAVLRDNARALYWALRAKADGEAMDQDILMLQSRLTADDREEVHAWLAAGKPPLPQLPGKAH